MRYCDCGFCYTSPRPTLHFSQAQRTPEVRNRLPAAGVLEPERQYQAATVFDYAHQLASDSNYRSGLAALKRVRAHGTLLDIGCAGGRFVELAREVGYEALGCDISEAAIAQGRARGLDLHLAPPNGLPESLPPVAVATLWNVL
jgi:2-polyprenyl-3-methyl-5-hydroxy-6-metoxy-1,4-benzoquinol methylase